ncbi:MBL fold metallo-hydrolase [Halobellus captivus]|uniref:MBL fold metallo-hydrolase n=1 Tax=Halobellus captivus TaxID=2592614 RepID=UPI0011A3AECB|nr:MBL fold metallo-hydrolase [Halobellus captivus]
MQVTYLSSAAIVVETADASVLCDPWLVDGAFEGSWCHYPPLDVEPEEFDGVDYIYISHIHPDHFDPATLRRMDTDIPVLIHDYRWDYLKNEIEALGFEVIELDHNSRMHLTGDVHVNILAADACDPEVCGNYFGCSWVEGNPELGSTQVDSMAVFDDGEYTVVNMNDCPYPMVERSMRQVKGRYGDIDLVCHQYSAAQFYPQCMEDYSHEEKLQARRDVILEKHELATEFIDLFDPEYYMPFAGEYVLAGRLAPLNQYTANPPRIEALEWFEANVPDDHQCVFLNSGEHLDLSEGTVSKPYEPVDQEAKSEYIENELSTRRFAYEHDPMPDVDELHALIEPAFQKFEEKRRTLGYETATTALIGIAPEQYVELSFTGDGYDFVDDPDLSSYDGYVKFELDPRLLARLLSGPDAVHWADAKIGSHLGISKQPDIYERQLYNCLGSFHA